MMTLRMSRRTYIVYVAAVEIVFLLWRYRL